jgi:23S rRNA pseudouridine2605 synthase
VLLSKKLTKEEHDRLMAGIKMRDGFAEISKLQYLQKRDLGASTGAWYTVHTLDGRRKFLSRFFEHVDATVVRQILLAIGPLRLPPDLKAGHYIQLDAKQIKDMRKLIDGKSQS